MLCDECPLESSIIFKAVDHIQLGDALIFLDSHRRLLVLLVALRSLQCARLGAQTNIRRTRRLRGARSKDALFKSRGRVESNDGMDALGGKAGGTWIEDCARLRGEFCTFFVFSFSLLTTNVPLSRRTPNFVHLRTHRPPPTARRLFLSTPDFLLRPILLVSNKPKQRPELQVLLAARHHSKTRAARLSCPLVTTKKKTRRTY